MTSGTDISALYREFTDALKEVLAKNSVGPLVEADSRGLALPLKSIPSILNMNISSGRDCIHTVGADSKYWTSGPASQSAQ